MTSEVNQRLEGLDLDSGSSPWDDAPSSTTRPVVSGLPDETPAFAQAGEIYTE